MGEGKENDRAWREGGIVRVYTGHIRGNGGFTINANNSPLKIALRQ